MRFLAAALVLTALVPYGARAQTDPHVGTFSNGQLTVQLQQSANGQYVGIAAIQGTQFQVTGQRAGDGLSGSYSYQGQAFPWTAVLRGDVLVMQVDGQTVELRRQSAGATTQPQAPQHAGAAGQQQLSQMGREWQVWFAGKRLTQMDSYSSYDATGGGGGYSSKQEMDLCSDGRFFHSGSSSLSVDAGGGGSYGVSGYGGGKDQGAGTWRIIEAQGQVGLELRWQDGNVSQHLLQYEDNATYIDGTRTYITEDNTSCR